MAHSRQHGATPDTHLVAFFNGVKWSTVRSAKITTELCAATTIIRPQVGFIPEDVSARSMRAGSAMSLLMERDNTDTIRLVGRWRSDIMMRYLHLAAQTFTEGLAARMVQHGDYALTHPPMGTKTPSHRLLASPWTFMGYSARPGIGLVRIRQINLPYHTNVSKSIPSSSVDTQIPLAGKVALATVTCRVKGETMRTHVHTHTRTPFQILRI